VSRIVEFKVGKGKTPNGPLKTLELTVRLPEQLTEEGLHEAMIRAEALIDQWLEVETPIIPQLDIGEIQSLPWISYRAKAPCTKHDESGWIFTDVNKHIPEKQSIVRELILALEKADKHKLELGMMIYTFSGKENQFISRRLKAAKKE